MCNVTADQDQKQHQHQHQFRSSQDRLIESKTNQSTESTRRYDNSEDNEDETEKKNNNLLTQKDVETSTCKESESFASDTPYDPLIVLGVNLSPLHPQIQFYICAAGVFGFTIIYGYLQELLSVHIMGRKYAMFLSLCQLAGYSVWSNVLMYVSRYRRQEIRRQLCDEKKIVYGIIDEGVDLHSACEAGTDNQIKAETTKTEKEGGSISPLTANSTTVDEEEGQQLEVKSFRSQEKSALIPSILSADGGLHNRSPSLYKKVHILLSTTTSTVGTHDERFENDDGSKNSEYDHVHPNSRVHSHGPPFRIYLALSLVRAFDIGLTNGAMKYLNYPAKTLIKSSRVAFTMFAGLLIGKKRYKILDYVMVSMLVFGLSIFLHADFRTKAVFHPIGVFMLILSLCCDGMFNTYSELIMKKHRISQDQFQASIYSIAFFIVLIGTITNGELLSGIQKVLLSHGTIAEIDEDTTSKLYHYKEHPIYTRNVKLLVLFLFTFTGLFGSSCAGAITKQFGALRMSVTSTTRKACTLFLSLAAPGFHNKCTFEHVLGMIIFISALFVKSFRQRGKGHSLNTTMSTKGF